MAETLETGELQRYVYDRLQPVYGNRYRRMVEGINKHLIPLGVSIPQTDREIVEEENLVVAQVSTNHDLRSKTR